ncbi:MAG: SUMF1/EgtB/PvdO family nonheme iron enzyme [Spirochaetaceae bacterium]|jgi:formylglycine-generating enzyme required for sulfatase activity|nr:SUMF1/EgtB/PvdO family nonheme iron enzyme [Spirochaetaceae bacterium]
MVRTMKNVAVFITALALVAGMVSCENWMIEKLLERNEPSDGGGNGGGGSNVAVERVEITNGTERGGEVRSALVIKTEVYPANATNREVKWSSDDSGIADVVGTANGATVHLIGVGRTEIRVKPANGGKEEVCTINVVPAGSVVPVTDVTLSISTLSLQVWDHPVTLIATVIPANATDKGVEWSPIPDDVVRVDNGMVTPVASGTATIMAKSTSNPAAIGICTVTVNAVPISSLALDTFVPITGGTVPSDCEWGPNTTTRTVGSFAISRSAVRYELWYIVKAWGEVHGYKFANPGRAGKSGGEGAIPTVVDRDQPVTTVNWRDAVIWCNAYSEMRGEDPVYRTGGGDILRDSTQGVEGQINGSGIASHNGYRLPIEVEWEYAARGGVPSNVPGSAWTYTYAGSNAVDDVAWYRDNSGNTAHPVGQKQANSAGLYDMNGNVHEWCFDLSSPPFYKSRGGSWDTDAAQYCTVTHRETKFIDSVSNGLGFRVVCR